MAARKCLTLLKIQQNVFSSNDKDIEEQQNTLLFPMLDANL